MFKTKYAEWEMPLEASVGEVGSVGEARGLFIDKFRKQSTYEEQTEFTSSGGCRQLTQLFVYSAPQSEPGECQRLVRMAMLSWHSRRIANQKEQLSL